jgi:hypothetical protein
MRSKTYTIVVQGRLSERFSSAFPRVSMEPGGDQTRIQTERLDQSQLHGLLDQLRDLAIELVSVNEEGLAGPRHQSG